MNFYFTIDFFDNIACCTERPEFKVMLAMSKLELPISHEFLLMDHN